MVLLLDLRTAQDLYQFHHQRHRINNREATITQMAENLARSTLPADKRAGQHVRINDNAQRLFSAGCLDIGSYFFIAISRVGFSQSIPNLIESGQHFTFLDFQKVQIIRVGDEDCLGSAAAGQHNRGPSAYYLIEDGTETAL